MIRDKGDQAESKVEIHSLNCTVPMMGLDLRDAAAERICSRLL